MLSSASELLGYQLIAKDGDLGVVDDLYFDQSDWVLRYLVVNTENWMPGRKILVSVHLLEKINWAAEKIPLELTQEEVRKSPEIDFSRTLTRQLEKDLFDYYRWPTYWTIEPPRPVENTKLSKPLTSSSAENIEPNLLSLRQVMDYQVVARDGKIGHIEDFILQEHVEKQAWRINYFILDTGCLLNEGNQVMLAPHWITEVDTDSKTISVDLKKDTIHSSPEFDPHEVIHA